MSDTAPSESNVSALDALASGEATRGKREPKSAKAPTSRQGSTRTAPLERRLAQSFTSIGVLVIATTRDNVCGSAIINNAAMNAANVKELCDQNPKVREAVERMMEGGVYGKVLIGFAVTLLPIVRHHNLLPGSIDSALSDKEAADKQAKHDEANPQPTPGLSDEAKEIIKNMPQTVPEPNDGPVTFLT